MRLALFTTLALLLLPRAANAGLPEDDGPFTAISEVDTLQAGPAQVQATVCVPNDSAPHPILALATNLTESRDVLDGLCLHLATWGFIAAVPDLGYANTDASSIGSTLLDSLAFFVRENQRQGSRFQGRIDPVHRGVLGFNTGAMGAIWAASQDDALSVAILLDPQDVNGQGSNAAPAVKHVPVLMLEGDPGVCNGNGSGDAIYAQLGGPRGTLHIVAGSDCDAEWPASQTCQNGCGTSHGTQADYFHRFTTAYAALFVGCDTSVTTHVSGAALQDLVNARNVDHLDQQQLPTSCGPYVSLDAGSSAPDAGSSSSSCSSAGGSPEFALALAGFALALVGLRRPRQNQSPTSTSRR